FTGMKNRIVELCVTAVGTLLLFACNGQQQEGETLFRGSAQIACDREIIGLIAPQIEWFRSRYEEAHIAVDTLDASEAMRRLLAGTVRAAFIARDYLPVEDSLLRAYSIEQHQRLLIATDAIVFAVLRTSALDTIGEYVLQRTIEGKPTSLSQYRWIIPGPTSSVTANLARLGGRIGVPAMTVADGDSVMLALAEHRGDIGVVLLSQFLRRKDSLGLRALRVVIRDSVTGDRIAVAPHAATIIKERYPFRVPIYGYLFESAKNFPFGIVSSIAHERQPQRAMLDAGIVPAYARFTLVEQE
ncbi:MAG: hypothetical protein N2663_05580, partial [Chlorobi bacterium]|nr:hypothetical protein [Chlorobiota bacterium]